MAISSALGSSALLPAGLGFRNLLINGDFRINQRGYTSGTSLSSGVYGFDRWKVVTGPLALTFTAAPQGQQITIPSLGAIRQIIERANIIPGTYVLSWTGTAGGRVYNEGASAPSYNLGNSLTFVLDGTANVVVDMAAGGSSATVGNVQLERNLQATPFEQRPIGVETSLCQRYYQRAIGGTGGLFLATGFADAAGTGYNTTFQLKTTMRVAPTLAVTGTFTGYDLSVQRTVTGLTSTRSTPDIASGDPTYGGGTFNANRYLIFFAEAGVMAVTFSAEL
jgi:hypothetical protein